MDKAGPETAINTDGHMSSNHLLRLGTLPARARNDLARRYHDMYFLPYHGEIKACPSRSHYYCTTIVSPLYN